ncbi:MAG: hypothetical protein H7834_11555 [Magnetococcus sp. YQC-9]
MSKRAIIGVLVVLLGSYLAGLVCFLPPERLANGVRAVIGERVSWKALSIGWEGVRFSRVRWQPPLFNPDRDIDFMRFYPVLWPLFSGRLAAGFQIGLDVAQLEGEASSSWDRKQARLVWRVKFEDLGKLATLWLGPLGSEVRGKGDAGGWFAGTTGEPQAVDSGEWESQLQGVVAFGAKVEPLSISGRIKEPNLLEITLAGKGDVAVSGKITVRIIPADPRASPLNGEVQIQPVKTNLPGLAGQFLARGQAVRLLVSGTPAAPQWRMP